MPDEILIPRKTSNLRKNAGAMNNLTFADYLDRLKLVAVSLFTWKNLDKLCGFGASRFIENALFEDGKACVLNDPELGYLGLRITVNGKLNTYNLPTAVEAYSITYHKKWKVEDVVYIMNNELQLPTFRTTQLAAYRLYEIQRAIDVNVKAQKTPIVIETDTKSRLTLENAFNQYDGNIPFIFGRKGMDLQNKLNAVKTDAPYVADKLTILKHECWNEFITFLGINNANTDKKERLISDEAKSNDELIAYYFYCFYKTREKAANEINEKYGLTGDNAISVEINKDAMKALIKAKDVILGGEDE